MTFKVNHITSVKTMVALAIQVIAASERETAQALHTAGWALRPAYTKAEDVSTADKVRLLKDYVLGRIQYEKPESEIDMFTGKTIFHRGEEFTNGVRLIWGDPRMYEIAKKKLDGALRHRLRGVMKSCGVKLRNPEQAVEMAQARKNFYAAKEQFEEMMGQGGALRVAADRLFIGEKVQARTLKNALAGTVFEERVSTDGGNKLVTFSVAEGVIRQCMEAMETMKKVAFKELPQEVTIKQAKIILATKEAKELLGEMAAVKADQLMRKRFWLAYALTTGEPVARVLQMTPEMLVVTEHLEEVGAEDLLGYYDSYERNSTPGMDHDGGSSADGSERNLRGETKAAQDMEIAERQNEQRLADIMEVMSNGCDIDEARSVWEEDGTRSGNAFAGGFEDISFESIIESGKIPVSINRAKAVQTKMANNRELLWEIEEIAAILGKRAKDEDWVLQNNGFDFNRAREEAIKLFKGQGMKRTDARSVAYQMIQDNSQGVELF